MKEPIRILHVVPDLAYGGVEKMVLNCYGRLDHSKYVFDFVTHGAFSDYHQSVVDQGCAVYYCQTIGRLGYKGYKKQIQSVLSVKDYDIVHVHPGHLTGIYARIFSSLGAKKIICHAHTTKCVNRAHTLFMPLFRHWSRRYSDALIACGAEAGRFCFGGAPFHLLPNGIDTRLYGSVTAEDIDKTRAELGIAEDAFVVGHVGHFSAPKNHSYIVRIIRDFVERCPKAVFVLVGDGPLKPEIEDAVATIGKMDNVVFTGVRNDIPILMRVFDVFILPSLHEGLPIVGVEAQAAGTPCLFSETIDASLNLGAAFVSFLPIEGGTEPWTNALDDVRSKSGLRIDFEKAHRALAESGYDVEVSAQRLADIYRSLLSR